MIEIRTDEGTKKVRAVWQSPQYAVTYAQGRGPDHPDRPRFTVTHLPSGMAAAQAFVSAAAARVAAQYLAALPTNWDAERPDTSSLPRNVNATLAWVRAQKEAPSLTEVQQRAAA